MAAELYLWMRQELPLYLQRGYLVARALYDVGGAPAQQLVGAVRRALRHVTGFEPPCRVEAFFRGCLLIQILREYIWTLQYEGRKGSRAPLSDVTDRDVLICLVRLFTLILSSPATPGECISDPVVSSTRRHRT